MKVQCEYIFDNYTYKCIVTCYESYGDTKITSFDGEHEDKKTNKDVTIIFFEGCVMTSFPRNLASDFFPNLAVIQLSDCELKKITREDLRHYPNLIYLGIIDCFLETLPANLFDYTPKVEFIDFSMNKIKYISPMIFDPLIRVSGVNLKYNESIHAHWIPSEKDSIAKSLEELKDMIKNYTRPLDTLQNLATAKCIENLSRKNAILLFYYGHRFRMQGLMRRAFVYLKNNVCTDLDEESFNGNPDILIKKLLLNS